MLLLFILLPHLRKLDAVDYSEKLTEIIKNNDIKSVTIVRMEVPCCAAAFRERQRSRFVIAESSFRGRS